MTWGIEDIPDMTGSTAVVTGANAGLGLEVAKALAGAGAHVVMAARNQQKAASARDDILSHHPSASLELVELDLASLDSIETASHQILRAHETVDLLVNNAGVMATPRGQTEDGFEMQLGVNHLGHWALTARLLPALLAAPHARVVSVTSTAHHYGRPLDPEDPHLRQDYSPWKAYGQSKLANYHFALGLDRWFRRNGASAESLVAHPGLSNTNLQTRTVEEGATGWSGLFWQYLASTFGMPPAEGALPILRAATDPKAKGGQMYAPRYINSGPPVRRPILRRLGLDRAIDTLWRISASETGLTMDTG